jgi:transposase
MKSTNDLIIKLLTKHIQSIPKLSKSFDFSHKQQKYNLSEYLIDILYVLKTGIAWRDLRSHINWNSVYKTYVKLNSFKIFKISYVSLLNKYFKKSFNNKLRYVSTDTSFIPNKKGKDLTGYNKFYNRKRGTKISLITDSKGIPFNLQCFKGNMYDSKILLLHLKHPDLIELKDIMPKKRCFLADPGYDSKQIRSELNNMNYEPLIVQNKRNIKDPAKLNILSNKEKKIYKKRLVIERTFNRMKMDRKLCLRYESKIENFEGFIYLSLIKRLCQV